MGARRTKRSLYQSSVIQIPLFDLDTEPVDEAQGRLLCHTDGSRSEVHAVEPLFEGRESRVSSDQVCERLSVIGYSIGAL